METTSLSPELLKRLIQSEHVPDLENIVSVTIRQHLRALVDRLLYVRRQIDMRHAETSVVDKPELRQRRVQYALDEYAAFAWALRVLTHPSARALAGKQAMIDIDLRDSCSSCGQALHNKPLEGVRVAALIAHVNNTTP